MLEDLPLHCKGFRLPKKSVKVGKERAAQGVTRDEAGQADRPYEAQVCVPNQKVQDQLEIGEQGM